MHDVSELLGTRAPCMHSSLRLLCCILCSCRTIQQESYEYSDPVTQFLEFLFVHYDFDGAQQQLKDCEAVIDNDFFLTACKEEFVENARLFIFEVRTACACCCLRGGR